MKKTLIIILLGAAVFFGGLFTVYTLISDKINAVMDEVISGQEEPRIKEVEVEAIGEMLKLDDFTVNLADKEAKRYIRVGITLEIKNSAAVDEVKKRLPQVRDAILVTLSSKLSEEIEGEGGKTLLRQALLTKMNEVLVVGKIYNLYFTDLVIQ